MNQEKHQNHNNLGTLLILHEHHENERSLDKPRRNEKLWKPRKPFGTLQKGKERAQKEHTSKHKQEKDEPNEKEKLRSKQNKTRNPVQWE